MGGALFYILTKLRAGGYGVSFNLYNSANFGAPQVRERVVLVQEFPDDWQLAGSIIDQYRQVGNAVPSSLGEAIGRLILNLSKNRKIAATPGFQYSRYCDTDDTSWEKDFKQRQQHAVEQLSLAIA